MHMKTHFSSISSYRDLSLSDFIKLASLIYIHTYMWRELAREGTPCDVTDVSATKLLITRNFRHSYHRSRAVTTNKIFLKELFLASANKRNKSVKIQYMSGSFLAETSVTSHGFPCHIDICYEIHIHLMYTYIYIIYIHISYISIHI